MKSHRNFLCLLLLLIIVIYFIKNLIIYTKEGNNGEVTCDTPNCHTHGDCSSDNHDCDKDSFTQDMCLNHEAAYEKGLKYGVNAGLGKNSCANSDASVFGWDDKIKVAAKKTPEFCECTGYEKGLTIGADIRERRKILQDPGGGGSN